MFRRKSADAFITCKGRDDGAGAQITAAISAMLYAKHFGYSYVHTPLQTVAHFPPEVDPDTWAEKWEHFFSLGTDEVLASDLPHLDEIFLRRPHRWNPKRERLNVVHHCHKTTDKHPGLWNEIRPLLRERYHLRPKPRLPDKQPNKRCICVHIRRGDVRPDNQFTSRFTPNERIVSMLSRTIEALDDEDHEVHIYSQSGSDFSDFEVFDPQWHLDEDTFSSFHALASCDVLLSAISSFSWLAGLINDGHVIQDSFWHPSMPNWINFSDIARLPPSQFSAYLHSRSSTPVPADTPA